MLIFRWTSNQFHQVGDVHADFAGLWAALRSAGCVTPEGQPTPPVLSGLYQVVLLGDLVHPKSQRAYDQLVGETYDRHNPELLARAAEAQIEGLRAIRDFQTQAPGSVHIILGNHDDVLVEPQFVLGTGGGLKHTEFDPRHGGTPLPPDLSFWVSSFLRELRVGGVQFAHVGPLPAHASYDEWFYRELRW